MTASHEGLSAVPAGAGHARRRRAATRMATRLCTALFFLAAGLAFAPAAQAQTVELLTEACGFFHNNEYFGQHADGYTLPGFYLRPRVVWHVDTRVTLEAGAHWLHYWGAHRYPDGETYGPWPRQDDSLSARAHVLPWFRVDAQLSESVQLTVGSLHPNRGHGLPLPLYNPERLFAADPEAGVQLQLHRRHLQAEAWVDWREFIWHRSSRQERFTFGLSAQGTFYPAERWQIVVPLHFLAQHVGGQALIERQRVQNHFNAAGGLGATYLGNNWQVDARCYALAYSQSNSPTVPFSSGWGIYPTANAVFHERCTVDIGYWHGHHYVSLLGSPLFSSLSAVDNITTFDPVRLATLGARYEWHSSPACTVSAEVRLYHYPGEKKATQYSAGIYVTLTPRTVLAK